MPPHSLTAFDGSLVKQSLSSQSASPTSTDTITNVIFGLSALGIGIATIWQGNRAWKLWQAVRHDQSHELSDATVPEHHLEDHRAADNDRNLNPSSGQASTAAQDDGDDTPAPSDTVSPPASSLEASMASPSTDSNDAVLNASMDVLATDQDTSSSDGSLRHQSPLVPSPSDAGPVLEDTGL